jgi:DNA replication and repair protein RecF
MLLSIEANNFRNFTNFSLKPSKNFNLIFGLNGSGKSSLLESIYFLALARSFRTHLTNPVVTHQKSATTIFGSVKDENDLTLVMGIQKARNGNTEIHFNGELIKTSVPIAKKLPIILINPDSYCLIHEGPLVRRQFLSWALFHVEQSFISIWRNFQKCLKQRNMALKQGLPVNEIQLWNKEFIQLGLSLDQMYAEYVEKLAPEIEYILKQLTNINGISIKYYSGWNKEKSLETLLKENFFREQQQGHTLVGPHRSDLKIKFNESAASEILSRGEQKLLIFAMYLAQANLLNKLAGVKSIYLIDDIAAELDSGHRKRIIEFLTSLDAQVFLTCLEREQLFIDLPKEGLKMFHVEQGQIVEEFLVE